MKRKEIQAYLISSIVIFLFFNNCSLKNDIAWIKTVSHDFVINNKKFKFLGANAVYLVFYDELNIDREKVIRYAAKNNIKVLRIFLDWGYSSLHDYDEIISLASKYGVYLILVLTDCCCSSDYPDINNYFQQHAPYCNPLSLESVEIFKKRIREIILHRNHLTGILYRDEPVVLAWDIANELEFWHFGVDIVKDWIRDIVRYIKKLDPNHLVTITIPVSTENFDKDKSLYNLFDVPELDYLSFSFYPLAKDYREEELQNFQERIRIRINRILAFKKPVVIHEFGFSTLGRLNFEIRNNPEKSSLYYKVIKEGLDIAFSSGVAGVLFWGWGAEEERDSSMWWALESHTLQEKYFLDFLRKYKIPSTKLK